jgi:hypothetical protein
MTDREPTISVHSTPGSAVSCFGLKICAYCEGFTRELQNRVRRIFILAYDPGVGTLFLLASEEVVWLK